MNKLEVGQYWHDPKDGDEWLVKEDNKDGKFTCECVSSGETAWFSGGDLQLFQDCPHRREANYTQPVLEAQALFQENIKMPNFAYTDAPGWRDPEHLIQLKQVVFLLSELHQVVTTM